jgi:hypothetical protein
MPPKRDERTWFPKLVNWENFEIPVPGREAVVGFFAVLAASLLLHVGVLWVCSLFGR